MGIRSKSNRYIDSKIQMLAQRLTLQASSDASSIPADYNISVAEQHQKLRDSHSNPFARYGQKCFSQSDEDGITLEILHRLELINGNYAEFGVGDGTENNTLILGALGWKGFWIGGEDLAFSRYNAKRFQYTKAWITLENIVQLAKASCTSMSIDALNVISLDLDGNDLYFAKAILDAGLKPDLFIVEYNAKFPPPIKFTIDYNEHHQWSGDDYFGASLCSFNDLFGSHEYSLVCCNATTGVNAFFVANKHRKRFPEVPEDIRQIYTPPNYHHHTSFGHRTSVRTIEQFMNSAT